MPKVVSSMSDLHIFLQDQDGKILSKDQILKEIGEVGFTYLKENGHLKEVSNGWKVVFKK
jgi:hypothetical protein